MVAVKELTPKQQERLRAKIAGIRKALNAEKRKFGWYDDSRGLRYLPPELYIKLHDYKGGLNYLRWFRKNFPDDIGFPHFLFEWTLILFKNGKEHDARQKALETWFSNTYLFDKFFGRPLEPMDKYEDSNLEAAGFTENFTYTAGQAGLEDFALWLGQLERSEKFRDRTYRFLAVRRQLKTEDDRMKRMALLARERQLLQDH